MFLLLFRFTQQTIDAPGFIREPPDQSYTSLDALGVNAVRIGNTFVTKGHTDTVDHQRQACRVALKLRPGSRQLAGQVVMFLGMGVIELDPHPLAVVS